MADNPGNKNGSEINILSLANEVIEKIFNLKLLDHKDICSLSMTCHRLSDVANSKEVWRVKAKQR